MRTRKIKEPFIRPGAVWVQKYNRGASPPRTIRSVEASSVVWEPLPRLPQVCAIHALHRSRWMPAELLKGGEVMPEASAGSDAQGLARLEAKIDRVLALLGTAGARASEKPRPAGEVGRAVLSCLSAGPMTREEISRRTGEKSRAVSGTLTIYARMGLVYRVADRWMLVKKPAAQQAALV